MARKSITRQLFISSGKVSLFQGLGLLLGFGFHIFISHTCGPVGLGAFTLFVTWLGILSVLTVPGLEGTLVYLLPRYERDAFCRFKALRVCLFIVGTMSLLSVAALITTGDRLFAWIGLPPNARTPFAFALIVFSLGKLLDSAFLGLRDAPAIGYFNIIRIIVRFIFCLPIFLYPRASSTILFYAIAFEGASTAVLRYGRLAKQFPELLCPDRAPKEQTLLPGNQIAAIALPMFGISIIDTLYSFLDKAVLGVLVSLELVGVYRVSESIASLNSMFVSPFIVFWPYISQLFTEKRTDELRDAYRRINLIIIALLIPFGLALVELSGFILSLFGPSFVVHGRTIFLILAFGFVVDAIAGPAGAVLKMTKHSRLSLFINLMLLFIYLGLSLGLTRTYGLLGAAIAKTVVMVVGNVTNVIANQLLLGIFPYTLKHAWLLSIGLAIEASRSLFPNSSLSTGHRFGIAFGEAGIFCCLAVLILRSETTQIIEQVRSAFLRNEGIAWALTPKKT